MRNATVTVLALVGVGAVECAPRTAGPQDQGTTTVSGRTPSRRATSSDLDGDGVPNFADKCPGKKETRNGYKDDDGCPDVYPVLFGTKRIRLRERITFRGETSNLTAASEQLLNALALGLKKRPKIMLVEIRGHVASLGPADYNRRLSRQRAARVRRFLVRSGGVSKLRLSTAGYGATRPLCKNRSRACHATNSRIELHIIWQGGQGSRVTRRGRTPGSRALLPARHRSALTRSAALRLRQRRLQKLFADGVRLLKRRRYTAAYQSFRAVVRDQPNNLQARLKLGVLQARLGDHSGANETVRWVRQNVGDDAAYRLRQAQLKVLGRRKP